VLSILAPRKALKTARAENIGAFQRRQKGLQYSADIF
jgi:hypothetical protein